MQWSLFFLCFVGILSADKYVNVYKYVTSAQDESMFTATEELEMNKVIPHVLQHFSFESEDRTVVSAQQCTLYLW